METEWRQVPGYEGRYEVSSDGRVRSYVQTKDGRVLRASGSPYPQVELTHPDKKNWKVEVHTLVALAFLGPRPEGQEVRHWDGNPKNNRVTNLLYGTRKQNAGDMLRHGRQQSANRGVTHCKHGHAFTPENTYRTKQGYRACRECGRRHNREWYARKKEGR